MVNLYGLSAIVFIALIATWLIRDRRNIEREFIVFMRRTERGRGLIYGIADRCPRLWAIIGDLGVAAGFIGMAGILVFMFRQVSAGLVAQSAGGSLALIVPVITAAPSAGSFWVGVPFWYFIIVLASVIVVHEGFHGIQTRVAKAKIKSIGLALLAVIPGAFVEPDEKTLNRKPLRSRLRVYAAGSAGNFLLAGVSFALLALMSFSFMGHGIAYEGYIDSARLGGDPYSAEVEGLGGVILSVDGNRIDGIEEYFETIYLAEPGDAVSVRTTTGSYDLTLSEHPVNSSYTTIGLAGEYDVRRSVLFLSPSRLVWKEGYESRLFTPLLGFTAILLSWMVVLNLGIGLFNLLPLKPLDGGLMFEALSKRVAPGFSDVAIWAAGSFTLVLILLSFLAPHLGRLIG